MPTHLYSMARLRVITRELGRVRSDDDTTLFDHFHLDSRSSLCRELRIYGVSTVNSTIAFVPESLPKRQHSNAVQGNESLLSTSAKDICDIPILLNLLQPLLRLLLRPTLPLHPHPHGTGRRCRCRGNQSTVLRDRACVLRRVGWQGVPE